MSLVQARGLTRRFGRDEPVVEGVDLEVAAGEVIGLLGPNGAGKSTLLLLLAGLLEPTSGRVTVDGVPAHELAMQQTGAVGLITAEPGLYPLLTGRENLYYFARLYGLSSEEVEGRVEHLLDELGLRDVLDRRSSTYSSGLRQKVSLARALLLEPKLLLLDEPTANLDPLATLTIHRAVRRQAERGVAVVMATHALHAAEHVCNRVGFVRRRLLHVHTLEGDRCGPPPTQLHRIYERVLG